MRQEETMPLLFPEAFLIVPKTLNEMGETCYKDLFLLVLCNQAQCCR
jgi:hypothetical protein